MGAAIRYTAVFSSLILLLLTPACSTQESVMASQVQSCPSSISEPLKPKLPPTLPSRKVTILAVGDNLIHDVIYKQAGRRTGGTGYDFVPVYSAVAPIIKAADIAVINQETILASDIAEPSSYPLFCSPVELGEQLLDIGFDVFTQANNHSYDKGAEGIRAAMDFWDNHPQAITAGLYRDSVESERIAYTEVDGVKIAFLAVTEHTNGLSLTSDVTEGVWLLGDTEHLADKLDEARQNADFVVVSTHWGDEGAAKPNKLQQQMAEALVRWGADLVLGSHPHVLQQCETVTRADGSQGLVVYSLGNFISAQQGAGNMAGGLMEVTIEKQGDNRAAVVSHRLIPTVTQYGVGYSNVRVLPFAQYTAELAESHGVKVYDKQFNLNYLTDIYKTTYPDCVLLPDRTTVKEEATPTEKSTSTAAPTHNPAADAELEALCERYGVVGMSIAAFRDKRVAYTHSYGYSNLEKKTPATDATVYRTASVAKPITSMVAMQLYDDGSIDLDTDISKYIGLPVRNPNFPETAITLRMLLTHTSSVIDSGAYYASISSTPFSGLSKLMKYNVFSPYAPGSTYIYSNLSNGMVGCVAQGSAGEHLWSLAERRLFTPLGVSATYLSKTIPDQSSIAHIYSGGVKTFDPVASGTAESYYSKIPPGEMYMLGHGDLYLTASDLARLGMVLAGDGLVGTARILKSDTVSKMNSLQFHAEPREGYTPEVSRGLGVQLLPDMLPDMEFAGHQGNAYGMMGCLLYRPGTDAGFAMLTNGCQTGQRDGVVYDFNREAAEIIYRLILTKEYAA